MSALDDLSDAEFAAMMPGLLALFSKQGWMVLIWGILMAIALVPYGIQLIRSDRRAGVASGTHG